MQWENVYVFISSTFNDMHAERDYLVKKVFPQLSAWCAARKLRLVDIDLRWGVSEADATENKRVVQVCLDRIDECRPFFLCFLGQRRGWVPAKEDIGAETYHIYQKLEEAGYAGHASVTEMEILHALVDPLHGGRLAEADGTARELPAVEHAFFYLRDPGYLDRVVGNHLKNIYTNQAEADPAAADAELKKWRDTVIPDTGRPITRYSAQWDTDQHTSEIAWPTAVPTTAPQGSRMWQDAFGKWERQWQGVGVAVNSDGTITGQELEKACAFNEKLTQGRLGDFSAENAELADIIISQLKGAITARFGAREEQAETPLQKELDQQAQFLHVASEGFIEREGDFDALDAYVAGADRRPMAIAAPAGTGKTSLLAHFIDTYRLQGDETLHYRFVGGSDLSSNVDGLLRSLLTELKERGKIESDLPLTATELRGKAYELLEEAGKQGKTILVIDALNQLETGLSDLAWIPAQLPEHVRLVVSFKRGEEGGDAWYKEIRENGSMLLHDVHVFAEIEDRRKLVGAYLSSYFKELDEAREDMLVRSAGSDNPLFLKTVLSELRQFGAHQSLNEYIRDNFGESPISAFDAVLRRMENDPPYASLPPDVLVPHIFGWLAHAQQGLSQRELAALLKQQGLMESVDEAGEAVAVVLRQLRPYLAQRDGRVDFFYESFRIAARQRYTGDHPRAKKPVTWHAGLAAYFEEQPFEDTHKLMELAYQYAHARITGHLVALLTDYRYLDARLMAHGVDALTADFELPASAGLYLGRENEHLLKLLHESLLLSTEALTANPAQLAQQLYGRLLGSPLPQLQQLLRRALEVNQEKRQLWLRPCFRYMDAPGGALRRMWRKSGYDTPMTPDGSRMVISLAYERYSLVDLDTGKVLKEFPQPAAGFSNRRRISADGHTLFMVIHKTGETLILNVIDLRTGACKQVIPIEQDLNFTGFSASDDGGRLILHTQKGDLIAYEKRGDAWEQVIGTTLDKEIGSSCLSRDGSIALVGKRPAGQPSSNEIEIWDMDARACVDRFSLEGYWLSSMALAADNDTLLLGLWDKAVLWSLKQKREVRSRRSKGGVVVNLTPDGKTGVCSEGRNVVVFSIPDMAEKRVLERHIENVDFVAISADGSRVISASIGGSVRLWDARVQAEEGKHAAESGFEREYPFRRAVIGENYSQAALSADCTRLAAIPLYSAKSVVFDTQSGGQVCELPNVTHNAAPGWFAFSTTGRYAAGTFKEQLRVWDARTGEVLFTTPPLGYKPECVRVLEEKRQVLLGDEGGTVHIIDVEAGRETGAFQAHTAEVWDMALSNDQTMLLTSALHPTVSRTPADDADEMKAWNTADFSPHGYAAGLTRSTRKLSFRPDDRQYAMPMGVYRGEAAVLWDAKTNNPQSMMFECPQGGLSGLRFSRDGRWLMAFAGYSSGLALFDTREEKLAFRLYSSEAHYIEAWFTPQGDLAALCGDGELHYFRIENPECAALAPRYTPLPRQLEAKAKLFFGAGQKWFAEKNFALARQDYEIAVQCYTEMVGAMRQTQHTEMLAYGENQLGMCCGALGDDAAAAAAYAGSAQWYEKLAASGEEKHLRSLGQALWNVTITYARLDTAQALEYITRCVAVRGPFKDASEKDMDAYTTAYNYMKKLEQNVR